MYRPINATGEFTEQIGLQARLQRLEGGTIQRGGDELRRKGAVCTSQRCIGTPASGNERLTRHDACEETHPVACRP